MSTAAHHLELVLHRLAGDGAVPRADQVEAVAAIVQPAARVLVVQATGWGKSAVYWAATSAMRANGAGPGRGSAGGGAAAAPAMGCGPMASQRYLGFKRNAALSRCR